MMPVDRKTPPHGVAYLDFDHWILPFDSAQGAELVEPFRVSDFVLGI